VFTMGSIFSFLLIIGTLFSNFVFSFFRLMVGLVSPATKLGQSHQIKALLCQHMKRVSRGNSISRFAYKRDSSQAGDGNKGRQLKQLDYYFAKLSLSLPKSENAVGNDKTGIVDSAARKYKQISDFVADAKQSMRCDSTTNDKSDVTFLLKQEKFKSVPTESDDSDFFLM
jgi:hypothetical protein